MKRGNQWWCKALLLAAGLVALRVADVAAAETPNDRDPLTLDQAIETALDRSPTVQAMNWKATAAHDQAGAVHRTRWGRLDAVASMSRFDEDRLLVPMSSQLLANGLPNAPFDRDQFHYGLSYQIPLYLGGKLSAGIEIARLEADKADALREGTRWQIRFNVVSLYASVQTLDGAIWFGRTNWSRPSQAVQKRLDLMVETGKRPELDLLKVEDQLAEARAQLADLQARRTRVAGLLLSLLGQDPAQPLTVTPLADIDPHLSVTTDSLKTLASVVLSDPGGRADPPPGRQRHQGCPRRFPAQHRWPGRYMAHHAGSVDDDPTTWQLSLGVKLPLFSGTSRFAALSAAKANQRAADERLKLARLRRRGRSARCPSRDYMLPVPADRGPRPGSRPPPKRPAASRSATTAGASTIEDLLRARTREEAAHTALAQATGELKIAAEQINAVVETEVIR